MATERNYNAVPPVLLTADGSTDGILQVTDTAGFFIQMQATLVNNLGDSLTVYVKRVVSSAVLWVGPTKGGMDHNVDVSAFTVATSSSISAQEQLKPTVPMEARLLSTYANDPIDAWRTQSVDQYGNPYSTSNPVPVVGDISIVPVSYVDVKITYDSNNNPVLIKRYTGTLISPVLALETQIIYDSNNNPIEVEQLYP
jgi:hypothetical protein